jgi:hypothetical protein
MDMLYYPTELEGLKHHLFFECGTVPRSILEPVET